MNPHAALKDLLAQARKRWISQLVIRELIFAASIGLAATVVVLLLGTALLSAYWIVPAGILALGIGLYLMRRQIPTIYVVAQWVDARLKLADALSTAFYFLDSSEVDPAVRDTQLLQAEHLAETANLKQALPFAPPRSLYVASTLALAVAGIFLVRFAATGSFDTRAPLLKGAYDAIFASAKQQAKSNGPGGDQSQDGGDPRAPGDLNPNADFAGDPSANLDQDATSAANEDQTADGKDQTGTGDEDKSAANNAPKQDPSDSNANDGQNGDQNGKQEAEQSLLDKIREALNEVMNKISPQSDPGGKNQKSESAQNTPQAQTGQNQESNPNNNREAQNDGGQPSDAQQDSKNSQNQNSKDQKNGIGAEEGDKTARQAEALKAMGKISQLLGKRAENVSGEMLVEVGSTQQHLKTPVAAREASHTDAGSEIHRDEVPVIYEQFVQQYFDQIRKNPAPAKAAVPAAAPKARGN